MNFHYFPSFKSISAARKRWSSTGVFSQRCRLNARHMFTNSQRGRFPTMARASAGVMRCNFLTRRAADNADSVGDILATRAIHVFGFPDL
jgi:hypothetical protein